MARIDLGPTGAVLSPAEDGFGVGALYEDLEREHPGRFVVGLGGAHGANPLATLDVYLDRLDGVVPPECRVMAALGPRMLELARDRTAGTLPVLVTPAYAARARTTLGADAALAIDSSSCWRPIPSALA